MSNFSPFFDFARILSEFLHVNCNSIEKHRPVFFFADLCFVFEKKRMQKTAFLLAYTKKSTTLCFQLEV